MEREEILKRAQKEGNDEMEIQIKDKSIKYTYIAMVLVAAVFSCIREQQGLPIMDLCATVCFSVSVGQGYRFIKWKNKHALIMAILTLAVGICATVRFMMGH